MTLLAAALLAATPAHALSCALMELEAHSPADGATDVPVNVAPVLRVYGAAAPGSMDWDAVTVTLVDLDTGDDLPLSVSALEDDEPSSSTWQVQPDAPLSADHAYTLSVQSVESGELSREITFSTGSAEDHEAPEPAAADALIYDLEEDEWGTWQGLTVGLAGGEDEPGSWWRVEVADNADFEGALVRASLVQPARFFDNPCHFDAVADGKPGETWVRVTTIDAAGNAAEPQVTRFDGPTGGTGAGCATVADAPGALGALAGLVGLLAVGRRRR